MAGGEAPIDASNITRRLWIGSAPPLDRDLPSFDLLVLCAREIQPERTAFHGLVVRCPLVDDVLSNAELATALRTSKAVAGALIKQRSVLVTCVAGRNRSALVVGFALSRVTMMGADEIITLIQQRRAGALTNPHFRYLIERLVTNRRSPSGRYNVRK